MAEALSVNKKNRPLSPHLQIYRWQWTMAMSISHRITGVGLTLGTILLTAWIWSAAYSPKCFEYIQGFLASGFGTFILAGFCAAFWYHFFNGIRHMIWDSVHLLDLKKAYMSGVVALIMTAIFTVITIIGMI